MTLAEARAILESLRIQVITQDLLGRSEIGAGVGVGFEDRGVITRAAVVALSFPELRPVD